MAGLDNSARLKLESLFNMEGGYVLDLTNATFATCVRTSIGIDPYERYGDGLSKAKLLRAIWEGESTAAIAKLNLDLQLLVAILRRLRDPVLNPPLVLLPGLSGLRRRLPWSVELAPDQDHIENLELGGDGLQAVFLLRSHAASAVLHWA